MLMVRVGMFMLFFFDACHCFVRVGAVHAAQSEGSLLIAASFLPANP